MMTRERLDQATDDVLNAEAAKGVMGWELTVVTQYGTTVEYWRTTPTEPIRYPSEWSPSTSIADAWELVEKMQTLGFSVRIEWLMRLEGGQPVCGFSVCDRRKIRNQHAKGYARADTAPRAITIAAILAKREESK